MARTLPWLKSSPQSAQSDSGRSTKRRKLSNSDSAAFNRSAVTETTLERSGNFDVAKSPNRQRGSPPLRDDVAELKKIRRPRSVSPSRDSLVEGMNSDDIYVMVEDEFYDIAKQFTAHLHQAEYVRQRQSARWRNTQELAMVSTAHSNSETKVRNLAETKDLETPENEEMEREIEVKEFQLTDDQQSRLVQFKAAGEEAPAESLLQRMMTSPGEAQRVLTSPEIAISQTRASAGFTQAKTFTKTEDVGKRSTQTADEGDWSGTTESADASDTASDPDLDAPPTAAVLLPRPFHWLSKAGLSSGKPEN